MTSRDEYREALPSIRRSVPLSLAGLVESITCFDGDGAGGADREIASFVVPIIVSFADPFRIAFGQHPGPEERIGSFVSGLHSGYVDIAYDGPVSCVQINLTPIGARLFFAQPMTDFTTQLVPLGDIGDRGLVDVRDRLGAAADTTERLKIAAAFLESRLLGRAVDKETSFVWSELVRSRGTLRIDRLTNDLGWSRKRLSAHVRNAFGLTPKRIARIARFHHAVDLARAAPQVEWAGIAVECGYADQAHLVREFKAFAGEPPERWRGRHGADPAKQIFNTAGWATG